MHLLSRSTAANVTPLGFLFANVADRCEVGPHLGARIIKNAYAPSVAPLITWERGNAGCRASGVLESPVRRCKSRRCPALHHSQPVSQLSNRRRDRHLRRKPCSAHTRVLFASKIFMKSLCLESSLRQPPYRVHTVADHRYNSSTPPSTITPPLPSTITTTNVLTAVTDQDYKHTIWINDRL